LFLQPEKCSRKSSPPFGGLPALPFIQPGGSIRDEEVIKAADEHGMAMVFSGVRLFKH